MQDLSGQNIVITSGPTFAPIDAVRALTNRSTGRLGSVIAHTLMNRGAVIHFLAGETSLTPSMLYPGEDLSRIFERRITTVDQLRDAIRQTLNEHPIHAVLMAAAVLDYIPDSLLKGKKRSDDRVWTIRLIRGEKIIERIREWSPNVFLVGFKLETRISLDELTERAGDLMRRSGAQLVVANRLEEIGGERHIAYLIEENTNGEYRASAPLMTREAIGEALADCLAGRI